MLPMQVIKRLHLPDGLSIDRDWCVGSGLEPHLFSFLPVDLEPCFSWWYPQASSLVLHLAVVGWQASGSRWSRRSSCCVQNVHCIPFFLTVVVIFIIQSMTRSKRRQASPLSNFDLHLETFGQLAYVGSSSAHVVDTSNEGDIFSVIP